MPQLNVRETRAIQRALTIFEKTFSQQKITALTCAAEAKKYLRLRLCTLEHEELHALWLDSQHRLIAAEMLFKGTLTQTSVYPREIVKSALKHNAAGVIIAHNHPSGVAEPSKADEILTKAVKEALSLVEVRLIDHVIVAGINACSLAEMGLI